MGHTNMEIVLRQHSGGEEVMDHQQLIMNYDYIKINPQSGRL